MKKLFILLFAGLVYVSCGPSQMEYNALAEKNKELENEVVVLKNEISVLKTELDNYKNSPDRLYEEAIKLIENKDIESLKALCEKIEKYHPTSNECKKAKSALQKLVKERDDSIKAEEAKRMQAVNKLKKRHDDVSGITWYQNPYFTHYNDVNRVSLYIGQDESNVWLRLKMSYEGDNWIFFERAYLSYDGETKEVLFDEYRNKESDNSGGSVWEWIDVSVDDALLAYLQEMVKGKSLKMRLSGKYTETRNITGNERKALEDILLAYDVLKNEQK